MNRLLQNPILPAVDVIALDHNVITATQLGIFPLRHRRHASVIQADTHPERHLVRTVALAHGIADEATGHGTADGRGRAAVTVAHRIAQQATRYSADDGTQ